MHSTKVIVSSSLMRKRLTEIINKPIIEVEVAIDKIVFHLQDSSSEEIMCHSRYNHSPKIKFEKDRWLKMLSFLNKISEQPVTFSYDVNDNAISLSGVSIGF
jgi:hypothetical protein